MGKWIRCACFVSAVGITLGVGISADVEASRLDARSSNPWRQLIEEARALGLPTRFLEAIPSDFVSIEFEDLHTYAAEYHPEDHRMVLNRSLSFNAAGSVLRPLRTLHHRDVGTLFHELFHAYMDYLATDPKASVGDKRRKALREYARDRQRCRYTTVQITPVVQRKAETEGRELSEQESWEALNETWAVFVGWAVWTKLEAMSKHGDPRSREAKWVSDWYARLGQANDRGELRGYYEPEESEERALTKKRYLALTYRIAPEEAGRLMHHVMEVSEREANSVEELLKANPEPLHVGHECKSYPVDIQKSLKE